MTWKQPRKESGAPGAELAGTAQTHLITGSEETAGLHLIPQDEAHQIAIDRLWSWLLAPLPEEAQDGEAIAA